MTSNIGFVTCVELGRSCIEAVHTLGGSFSLFVTLRDDLSVNKSGRIYLDDLAVQTDTPLVKISHINDAEAITAIKEAKLDWLFIIGWSQIASDAVLSAPEKGVLGMHPTLLPVGRGRAAIPWAIIKGLEKTGVTLFKLDSGVDTGPILDQVVLPLSQQETATTLYQRANEAHQHLIRKVWHKLETGTVTLTPQDETQATVWPGRKPDDGRITSDMTVAEVERLVRALTKPYPGAFAQVADNQYVIWAGQKSRRDALDEEGVTIECTDGNYLATDFELL